MSALKPEPGHIRPAAYPQGLGGFVFDMDGLLLDTESIFKHAFKRAAATCGYDLPDHVFYSMIGTTRADSNRILVEAFGQPVPKDFSEWVDNFHAEYVRENGLPHKPGVEDLLAWCRARRYPCVVATSTYRSLALTRLEDAGLLGLFDDVVAGDQVDRGKPNPDIYLLAAQKLAIEPTACVALEDSYNGVRAAHAAGMTTYMVPDLLKPTAEMVELAEGIFPSLRAVREFLDEMPRG